MKYNSTNIKKLGGTPLSFIGVDNVVYMLVRIDKKTTSSIGFLYSKNGVDFEPLEKKVSLKTNSGKKEKIKICQRFYISRTPNGYVLSYVRLGRAKKENMSVVARSKDLFEWTVKSETPMEDIHNATVVYSKPKDTFEFYQDGLFIKNQSSSTLSVWKEKPALLFTSRNDRFDAEKISIIGGTVTTDGILLLYDASAENKKNTLLQVGAVIFDINNPKRIIWRSNYPVWQAVVEAKEKPLEIRPLGFATLNDHLFLYWITADFEIIIAKIPALFKEIEDQRYHPKILKRFENNPIIEPRMHYDWEVEGTFNPAVVEDDEGVIHLVYRAIGRDGISRVGYAQSKDGKNFTKRSGVPIFEPSRGFGLPDPGKVEGPQEYNPVIYTSGGGWGGAEDPRLVRIDGAVYMLYVAFEGWNSIRIALTSISLEDFKHNRWNWKKPKLISPPGRMNKNWVLFPEKINGKYAVLHGIAPKILIDYIDDIDEFDGYIYSPRPEGAPQPGRSGHWDNLLRGPGPSPIKTELGWLILYHAIDKKDSGKYKVGAMILDKKDPTKVLYRSQHPILVPDMHYENQGKPGVVFASGAVIRGDDLYVYYGGADKVVCVATTPLKEFLKYLKTGNAKPYHLKRAS